MARNPRTPIWVRMYRNTKWSEQGGRCFYCLKEVPLCEITADHLIPVSKRGKHEESNIVAACANCNVLKDNLSYQKFIKQLNKITSYNNLELGMLAAVNRVRKRADKAVYNIRKSAGVL